MLNRLFHLLAGDDLAIDLGTANTLISAAGEGLLVNEPSVVAVENGTNRVLSGGAAVGHLAKQMLGRTPESISAVRPLRAGVIADFTLCEAMLRYFLNKTRRRQLGVGPRVLVAVPGSITPVEKQAVYNTTHRAGARQVFLVHEGRAAAIGVGLPVAEPLASMVCDIGGGTTEVAVLSLADIVASQSLRVGGDSMDQAIADYLLRHYSLSVGQATAERLRIDIGSAFPLDDELVDEVRGIDRASGLPRRATVTSEEIRHALADPLEKIVHAIKAVVDRTSPDLVSDIVQQGMVLVGGGALVRGIDRFLAEQTGLPVRVAPDPQTAVAKGAQICLEHLSDWRGSLEAGDDDV